MRSNRQINREDFFQYFMNIAKDQLFIRVASGNLGIQVKPEIRLEMYMLVAKPARLIRVEYDVPLEGEKWIEYSILNVTEHAPCQAYVDDEIDAWLNLFPIWLNQKPVVMIQKNGPGSYVIKNFSVSHLVFLSRLHTFLAEYIRSLGIGQREPYEKLFHRFHTFYTDVSNKVLSVLN